MSEGDPGIRVCCEGSERVSGVCVCNWLGWSSLRRVGSVGKCERET